LAHDRDISTFLIVFVVLSIGKRQSFFVLVLLIWIDVEIVFIFFVLESKRLRSITPGLKSHFNEYNTKYKIVTNILYMVHYYIASI
jgi:hypothetical protein